MALTEEYFMQRVEPEPNTGCWLWIGGYSGRYGVMSVSRRKAVRTTRWAYEHFKGVEVPKHLLCCHKCDTPACVNPDHLFLGTVYDNAVDAYKKGRLRQLPKARQKHIEKWANSATCRKGHPWIDVEYRKGGGRRCRICRRNTMRKWKARSGKNERLPG